MRGIIAVDIGTTSMRAVLFGADGGLIHLAQQENAPRYFADGRVEQNPEAWKGILPVTLKDCAEAAAIHGISPACIAVTAQRSSVIPVSVEGNPLHPAIMWQDKRTAELAGAMAEHDSRVYRKTGLKISPVFSALKMTWLRRNRPDVFDRTYKLIGIQDWVIHLLTGRFVTDHTFASRTNLFDLQKRTWDAELLRLFEVDPDMLCELVEPGSIVGGLCAELAAATGLVQGLPVVTAGGDQQCAALGLGLFSGERAVSNTGTGSFLIGHSDTPAFDEQMRLACNVSAVPNAYIVEAAVLTSGSIYRWFSEFLPGSGSDAPAVAFAELDREASGSPSGANGLLMLPHFKGCGAPYWDPQAKGVFYDLTLGSTRGDMARAILEGIAIEIRAGLDLVERLCGRVSAVSVSGGMARSDVFNQIQSDIYERTVVRYRCNEATALGAWIAGAVACGMEAGHAQAFAHAVNPASSVSYRPDPANRPIYARQCRRARALYQAVVTPEVREQIK